MISRRIREIRQGRSMTQQEFADLLHTSSGHISEIENGKKVPGGSFLRRVCMIFDVDANWLLRGNPRGKDGLQRPARLPGGDGGYVPIPVVGFRTDAGEMSPEVEGEGSRVVALSEEWVHTVLKVSAAEMRIVPVGEDSMEPTFRPGDLVMVHCLQDRPRREGIYVLELTGSLIMRRVQFFKGGMRLFSDNPMYEPFWVSLDEMHAMHILGRVLGLVRPVV